MYSWIDFENKVTMAKMDENVKLYMNWLYDHLPYDNKVELERVVYLLSSKLIIVKTLYPIMER